MKAIGIGLAIAALASGAHAQQFTISWTSHLVNQINAPVTGGSDVGAVFTEINGQVLSGGQKIPITGQCATWTAPPGQIFERNGVCMTAGPNGGKASFVYGCDWDSKEHTGSACWGFLSGLGGPVDKRVGQASWHLVIHPDRKSADVTGSGQWN
ncbi:MAG TPA: hypothetical protein VGS12_13860 [Caulobacteraceae bacterium]|nr:hypothetical protein [Caulobacteraceae bacterium]